MKKNLLAQRDSSVPSLQSIFPSQTLNLEIHCPFPQVASSNLQADDGLADGVKK